MLLVHQEQDYKNLDLGSFSFTSDEVTIENREVRSQLVFLEHFIHVQHES